MTKYTVVNRSRCRLCAGADLVRFMHFDAVPFFDEVVTRENRGSEFSYPMEIHFCRSCASVQTQHDVNLHEYYHTYQYTASKSPFIRSYMRKLVDHSVDVLGLKPGDKAIEIGAADGYLLSLYQQRGLDTLGFEAAGNLCQLAQENGVTVINDLFTRESIGLIPPAFAKAQLIVLLHTFDHLYDPAPFLETVREVLDDEQGILLLEVHDLQDIHAKHETALFGHEHATYLHYGSMKRFLERHGLRMIDFNFLPKQVCRGSSMLIAATPQGSRLAPVKDLSVFADPKLDELSTFMAFQEDVARSYANLRAYIETRRRSGKRFAGYGGWGRGVTTLAMAGLTDRHLEFVVDGNPGLHGCYTPVTEFEIVGPEAVTRAAVDEVVVFNYAYISEIRDTLSGFIADGGRVHSVIDLLAQADSGA
ncbi:MAG: methyltransferase domain-containing protein [Kiloniellaceae bacterium]|mgnify:CR=1 FL=1